VKEETEIVKPSKALFIEHPFGLTLGAPGDRETQGKVLKDCLSYAEKDLEPGAIVDLPYGWTADDLRERQLRKEAL